MRSILVVSLLLLATLAQADDVRINFYTLLTTYDNSAKKSFDNLKGVYAGKCIGAFGKKVVGGVLFIIDNPVKKVFVLVDESNEDYFYTSYTQGDIDIDIAEDVLSPTKLISEQPLVGEDYGAQLYVGKYQGDLVVKTIYEGEAISACLFTKTLR